METKTIAIYCRVSTKEQAEEGNSLSTQERICREYADRCGFSISKIFIERGKSGKTQNRTELQNLFEYCHKRKDKIFAVVVYKIDRLSRNLNDYINIKLRLQGYGTKICSTSEQFENDPAGRFMENILANVAQFDNDVRTERSVNGMKDAVRAGRFICRPPYGYINSKVDNAPNIIPNPVTGGLVIQAFNLISQKKHNIEATRAIMSKKGMNLSKPQFYRIFKNRTYYGIIERFGERNQGCYQPLITKECFDITQFQLRNPNKNITPYRTHNPDFPLRRFIRNQSGLKLTGSWSKGKSGAHFAYYRFMKKGSNYKKDNFESEFRKFLNQFAFDRKELDRLLLQLQAGIKEFGNATACLNEAKSKELKDLEKTQGELIQKNLKGIISDVILKQQLEMLETRIGEIQTELQIINEEEGNYFELSSEIEQFLLHPGTYWFNCDFEIKIKLQSFLFPQGVVFDEKEFRTPFMSLLFKGKDEFLHHKSHLAGRAVETTNTPDIPNPPSLDERTMRYMDEFRKFKKYVVDGEPMTEVPLWYKYQKPHKDTLRSRQTPQSTGVSRPVSELFFRSRS